VAVKEQHVLVAREEVTEADRQWAAHYHVGDVTRYTKGSHTHRLAAGKYARVVPVNAASLRENARSIPKRRPSFDGFSRATPPGPRRSRSRKP
jgi:hypothetical protein